jgi:hypothetical protein
VTIAGLAPANLLVIVGVNGAYEVTGAQPTPGVAAGTDLAAVARGCGIGVVHAFASLDAWHMALPAVLAMRGPVFVALDIEVVPGGAGPRSPGRAGERARTFMAALPPPRTA